MRSKGRRWQLVELMRNEIRQTGDSMNPPAVRPSNVVRFEQLMYVSIGIGTFQLSLQWNQLVANFHDLGGATFVLFVWTFALAIRVLLIWLVARRRNNWARKLLAAMFLFSTTSLIGQPMNIGLANRFLFVSLVCQIVALFLIFTGNAREWFEPPAISAAPSL